MSDNKLAEDYADTLARGIRDAVAEGFPFGYYNELTGDYSEDRPDGLEEDFRGFTVDADGNRVSAADASHWIENVLDMRWILDRDGSYRSAEFCLTLGGPTAWLSTEDNSVRVSWGGSAVRYVPAEFTSALDDYAAELWESIR